MTPIAEVRIPVQLDRERTLVFDINTMRAYEEATAKMAAEGHGDPCFYWDTMLRLFEYYEDNLTEILELARVSQGESIATMRRRIKLNAKVMHYISARDLNAMIWACLHEYEAEDTPVWPLTAAKVARILTPQDSLRLVQKIIEGHNSNSPSKAQMGEASGPALKVVEKPAEAAPKESETGGIPRIELPEDVCA